MKPPERFPPDDPREWINRARSNLTKAANRVPGVYLEDLCFDAQQAADKAVKALLIGRCLDFPHGQGSPSETVLHLCQQVFQLDIQTASPDGKSVEELRTAPSAVPPSMTRNGDDPNFQHGTSGQRASPAASGMQGPERRA